MKPIEFKIPMLPPSLNSIYKINYVKRECYMDKNARKFKCDAKLYTPNLSGKYVEGTKLIISVKYYGNWKNKDGSIKRKDGQNLDTCLYDAIFEKMGVDDKVAFKGSWEKIQSDEEFTIVKIEEYKKGK